ncbi:MAG: hypothetical protein ACRDMX_10635 [Solirubrobacteraceae bacterium]
MRRHERWTIAGVVALVTALAVAVLVSFASPGPRSGRGCISFSLAYSTGGAQVHRCGAAARAICVEARLPGGGGLGDAGARAVAGACRRAGLR